MEGKIFNDSANIYQDQAKVLYEYYKSAAEKIVNEEKIYEDKIKNAEYQIKKYNEDMGKAKTIRTIGWVFCWTLVGLIVALIKNSQVKEFESLILMNRTATSPSSSRHIRISSETIGLPRWVSPMFLWPRGLPITTRVLLLTKAA